MDEKYSLSVERVKDVGYDNPFDAEASFTKSAKTQKIFESLLNPVMMVFIRKLSLSTLR